MLMLRSTHERATSLLEARLEDARQFAAKRHREALAERTIRLAAQREIDRLQAKLSSAYIRNAKGQIERASL